MMKNVKSQLFVFDLIFSVVILVISFSLVLSYFSNTYDNIDIYDLNNQIMNGFTLTELNSLNGDYIRNLFISGEIRNYQNTVAQQVSEFYFNDFSPTKEDSKNLTKFFVEDYIKKQFNFNITLKDTNNNVTVLYEQINSKVKKEDSTLKSVTQRSVYGFKSLSESYGPYTFKIEIWQ